MNAALHAPVYRPRTRRVRRSRHVRLWLAVLMMILLNGAVWGGLIALSRGLLTF